MFFSLLTTGLLLGLDSFAVSLAIGAVPGNTSRRRWLVLSFALCDGLASWFGAVRLGVPTYLRPWLEWLGPAAVAAYGLYVLALAWRAHRAADSEGSHWLALGLPVCLSLDNLVAGVGGDLSGLPPTLAAVVFGAMSGGLALLGLVVGESLARPARAWAAWLGGGLLLAVAAVLSCLDSLP